MKETRAQVASVEMLHRTQSSNAIADEVVLRFSNFKITFCTSLLVSEFCKREH